MRGCQKTYSVTWNFWNVWRVAYGLRYIQFWKIFQVFWQKVCILHWVWFFCTFLSLSIGLDFFRFCLNLGIFHEFVSLCSFNYWGCYCKISNNACRLFYFLLWLCQVFFFPFFMFWGHEIEWNCILLYLLIKWNINHLNLTFLPLNFWRCFAIKSNLADNKMVTQGIFFGGGSISLLHIFLLFFYFNLMF